MKIINMNTLNQSQRIQAAQMLADELSLGWPTLVEAMEEVDSRLGQTDGAVFLAAVEDDEIIGWTGILLNYDSAFELHPLVVRSDRQGKGVGRRLVDAISEVARQKGGLTLYLGADDDKSGGETSLANVNLYDDLPKRLQDFDPGTHQSAFYITCGFKVVGVIPDASGMGKPDIYMAKPLY